jgi:hypothetical protein
MGSVASTNDIKRIVQQEILQSLKNNQRGSEEEKIKRIVQQELRSQNNNKSNNDSFPESDTKKPIDFMEFKVFDVCENGQLVKYNIPCWNRNAS